MQLYFLLYADHFYKQDEDHQDYLRSFMNNLGSSIMTATNKKSTKSDEVNMLDDDLSELMK